ncbi:hypothetical protein LSH36_66g01030 [Paralvinella palmiformis]|uniref:Uncharacterized protein n=1 Tax=Paralvinella palmiformis TaxID=53620 RepID=A0AAD9K3J8_9ANNE|nr:hypothetical protein LSH36_66g01030 [Paralvinella palmiformis]
MAFFGEHVGYILGRGVMVFSVCLFFAARTEGLPARGCPRYSATFYVPDKLNRCVYYKCLNGRFIGGPQSCDQGKGVPLFFSSDRNPCRMNVRNCLRYGNNGLSGIDPTYPAPTRTMFTYRPTSTPLPETTSESTTELIEMMTTEEPEMTTQAEEDTTEELGSGDVNDGAEPGTPGVFFDKAGSGGLSVTATTQNECLMVCSQVMDLCWGLDWNDKTSSCVIHLTLSEQQCGPLVAKPNNVHFRFRC